MKIDNIGVMESDRGHWEIIRDSYVSEDMDMKFLNSYRLLFVPGEDYSSEDVSIKITKEQLVDLVKMVKGIKL